VHVDPRALGIGPLHQQVEQRKLRSGLRTTLEMTVHRVGVDLNTASPEMLALVPGMTERVAKRVVDYRQTLGRFSKRAQLGDVPGLSQHIYKQAVGFARVRGGENPLDDTGIHPESYPATGKILEAAGVSAAEALEKPESLQAVALDELRETKQPIEVLRRIVDEFSPQSRLPRGAFVRPTQPVELRARDQLQTGGKVDGVVTNVANFGVFVDIGADQDGLVHVSQLSNKFVEDPKSEVKVGDRVEVYILALEANGKRISLSMRNPREAVPRRGRQAAAARPADGRKPEPRRKRRKEPRREGSVAQRSFGPDAKSKAREEKEQQKLSLDEKLALLQSKYRTKV
jgi:uncharacterized protein